LATLNPQTQEAKNGRKIQTKSSVFTETGRINIQSDTQKHPHNLRDVIIIFRIFNKRSRTNVYVISSKLLRADDVITPIERSNEEFRVWSFETVEEFR